MAKDRFRLRVYGDVLVVAVIMIIGEPHESREGSCFEHLRSYATYVYWLSGWKDTADVLWMSLVDHRNYC